MPGLQVCADVKLTKRDRKLLKLKFPECIGRLPDEECQNSTKDNPGKDCKLCPYFRK